MLRAGLELEPSLLALVAASHSGEDFHLDGVRRILAGAGLDERALATPAGLPLDARAADAWRAAGRAPSASAHNCSGKHAGMLATCVARGWPTSGYTEPDHPLQRLVAATVADLAAEPVAATGVDGCGAPVLAISTVGLARAFSRIATASAESPEGRVAHAVRAHPDFLGGSRRPVSAMIRGVPGLIAKDGAEGVFAAAMPDGRTCAVKIGDGAERAVVPALATLLQRLGVLSPVVSGLAVSTVLGGGRVVGRLEVTF
jgi:L-asparaginase II